ncbi:hypothetical protein [Paenibacillus sp. Z6-24]
MIKRPIPVAIISILVLAIGFLNLILISMTINRNLPVQSIIYSGTPDMINMILAYLGGLLLFVGGILAFRGENTGRWMIVGWCILALILYADFIIPRVVYLVIVLLILFNKSANRFFNSKRSLTAESI